MEKKFKISKYNYKIIINNNIFLYNSRTGAFLKIDKKYNDIMSKLFKYNDDNYFEINDFPYELIEYLKEGGFILANFLDELKLIKLTYNNIEFSNNNSLSLTIAPTLGCNFRCSYCFEKWNDFPNTFMNEGVMDAILNLIDSRLSEGGKLDITWYGGEPLLNFKILEKLQKKINNLVIEKKIECYSYVITNGYLLSQEVSEKLIDLGIKNIQITLDGSKETHDKKRFLINGNGTFKTITNNILNASSELNISIRVNIDKNNLDDMDFFIESMNDLGISDLKNVKFYFAIIRSSDKQKPDSTEDDLFKIKEFASNEFILSQKALKNGINVSQNINPMGYSCGAISFNSLVIEPDGTIQKCYELVGDKETSIGNILNIENGSLKNDLELKNLSNWNTWSPFESSECLKCKVLPLCLGGCPYYSIVTKTKDKTYKCSSLKYNLKNYLYSMANSVI